MPTQFTVAIDPDEPNITISQDDDGRHTIVLIGDAEIAALMARLAEVLIIFRER